MYVCLSVRARTWFIATHEARIGISEWDADPDKPGYNQRITQILQGYNKYKRPTYGVSAGSLPTSDTTQTRPTTGAAMYDCADLPPRSPYGKRSLSLWNGALFKRKS